MIVLLCVLSFLLSVFIPRRRKPGLPLPPGPPGLHLIGNILDFPTSNIARSFHDLAKRYRGLIYFSILGNSIIVLDSYEAACELLRGRGTTPTDLTRSWADYTSQTTLLSDFNLPLIPYGQRWRHHRRIFHQTLQLTSVNTHYRPNIQQVTHHLLLNLLETPKAFLRHITHAFVASVLSVGYGIKIPRDDERYGNTLHHTAKIIEAVVVPGKYLVELVPALQHLPRWFQAARFKKDANTVREKVLDARRTLYEEAKSLLDSESTRHSMLAMMVQRIETLKDDDAVDEEEQSTGALIGTYWAGSDTTVASLRAFFLAMAMFPDVQKKAQDELDRVIGRIRLPDFKDSDTLPYINAVVRELTRWNVVAPLALPHATLEDDEYNGYLIPKGSIVIANVLAYSRNPDVYPDPETFNPDRFLRDGEFHPGDRDPYGFIFGMCPGRHLAESSVFLSCASTLHPFSISPPSDDNGRPIQLAARVDTDSVIAHPKEFECIVKPRWAGVSDLVRA